MKRRQFIRKLGLAGLSWPAVSRFVQSAAAAEGKTKRIKVGQIGTAHAHASGKMASLRKLTDHYEVVGVVEPDAGRRQAAMQSKTYKALPWMSEEELLNVSGLKAVAVETEIPALLPTAAKCISAGLHIHLDKPAGTSLEAFKRVLNAAQQRQLTVQMGYMFRSNPGFQFLFRAVREGWLGDVFELDGVMSKTIGPASRKRLAKFSGGAMFELGCHLIDATVAVLGKPDRVTPFLRRTRPENDTLADNTLAIFEYPEATAAIRSAVMEVDGGQRRQMVVCGDRGTLVIRPLERPRVTLTLDRKQGSFQKGTQQVPMPAMTGRYDDELIDLARVIRGEKAFAYPPAHDLAVQQAVLRASGMD